MEERRVEVLAKAKLASIKGRILTLRQWMLEQEPADGVYPSVRDIARLPMVRSIYDVPASVEITRASYDVLKPWIEDFAVQWKKKVIDNLRGLIKADMNMPTSIDPFTLAVGSIWRCGRCCNSITYPAILAHRCWGRDDFYRDAMDFAIERGLCGAKNLALIHIESTTKIVKHVAELFGADPTRVTASQLDSMPHWVKCAHGAQCSRLPLRKHMMPWRSVVSSMALITRLRSF